MKTQVRRIEPMVTAERSAVDGAPPSESAVWIIEEFDGTEADAPRRTAGDRWLCLLIAALGALTGFGFLGRVDGEHDGAHGPAVAAAETGSPIGSPRTDAKPSADLPVGGPPLRLISPTEATTIETTVVSVEAVASRKLGTVQLAVVLGGAMLGRTEIDVLEAGPFSAQIAVFAPPVRVQVELVATVGTTTTRRTLWLHPGGLVGLWPVRIVHANGRTTLEISGYASVGVGHVEARVLAKDGRLLVAATADVGRDAAEPAFAGGYALGLGSFRTSVTLPGSAAATLVVVVDWRDAIGGQWGTEVQSVGPEARSPNRRVPGRTP